MLLEPVEVPARAFPQVGARVIAGVWVKNLAWGTGCDAAEFDRGACVRLPTIGMHMR